VLGAFLEFGFKTRRIGPALEFYRALGFQDVPVGDILDHPYAVVSDGDVCIGLHDRELEGPLLTFVRPQLSDYLRGLRRQRIELEFAHLADDEFNEVGFRDPDDWLVLLMEARSFSPGSWEGHSHSACGEFLELSLVARSRTESQRYWQKLGFSTVCEGEEPHPWIRLSGRGLTLGFHQTSHFVSGLSFKAGNLGARIEYLKAKGFDPLEGSPMAEGGENSATLITPEGEAIFLLED